MNPELEFTNLGGIPSPKDYRDIPLRALLGAPTAMPDSFFNDISMLPIENQKKIGSCTGHAGAKYRQFQEWKTTGQIVSLSPRFLYAMAKCYDGGNYEGTWPRLIMQTAKQYGVATTKTSPNESDLPHAAYIYSQQFSNVPKECFDEASPFKIDSYAAVGITAAELKQSIVNCGGCMLLLQVGNEWWTSKDGTYSTWDSNQIIPVRPPNISVSGHEVYVYGYDTDPVTKRLRIWFINSWSEAWGLGGKGWFYYEDYKRFLTEAITAVDLPNDWKAGLADFPKKEDFKYSFIRNMEYKQRSEDVKNLQIALMITGDLEYVPPQDRGFYGQKTKDALFMFQQRYIPNLSFLEKYVWKGQYCGPKTRTELNKLFAK